jgi:seryl-tRNA synthetase
LQSQDFSGKISHLILSQKEVTILDIRFIRENPDIVKDAARKKHFECDVDNILGLDGKRRSLLLEIESLRAERKRLSKKQREKTADEIRARVVEIKEKLAQLETSLREIEAELHYNMLLVPNIPADEVPEGSSEEENLLVKTWGTPGTFAFEPKDHLEIAGRLKLVDFERGAKVSGSRFYFLRGMGALLELSIMRCALDILVRRGFEPVITPMLVKPSAMEGTGFLPRGEDEAYFIERDNLYLVGTSEVPLVSFYGDEILDIKSLPLHYAGISSCFRREAGAAGRDTKGLYRLHQFQKIEQVVFCRNDPEESRKQHMFILENTEAILQALGLPYRITLACGGECGLPQIIKHEVETWMPSRNNYCETMSCSTIHDFQSRRLNIRYREENGKLTFVHTLNNTGIASPRILIPLLEHYQQEDGSVVIPDVLRPYMGGLEVITPGT